MKIYIAADHAGFALKESLLPFLKDLGHEVEDCGAFSYDSTDDYPDFIKRAAKNLSVDSRAGKHDSRAIVIGASGQGEAIVANRFPGVRAALYYGKAPHSQTDAGGELLDMIASFRHHNDANALSLGARFLSDEEAKGAAKLFLESSFSGEERHARRIKKIDE